MHLYRLYNSPFGIKIFFPFTIGVEISKRVLQIFQHFLYCTSARVTLWHYLQDLTLY